MSVDALDMAFVNDPEYSAFPKSQSVCAMLWRPHSETHIDGILLFDE